MTAENAIPTVTFLVDDIADRFAMAEEVGFSRALALAEVPDAQRWTWLLEYRRTHDMRTRLYAAQLKAKNS